MPCQWEVRQLLTVKKKGFHSLEFSLSEVPTDSPLRAGDVAVYVFDLSQPNLPTPFCSVLVSVFVFIALSTVFHSIYSPDNSSLSHPVLPALFLPYWSFQPYISLYERLLQP